MRFGRRKRGKSGPGAEGQGPADAGAQDAPTVEGGEPGAEGEGEPGGLIAGTRAALRPVKKRHVVVASLGLMGFAAAGLLLFSAASFWWTSQPSFCNKCHVMEKYVDTWDASPHTGVNCESCHINPGFFAFMGGKVAGLQVVANYIRGTFEDTSFSAAVSNAACRQCHEDMLEKTFIDEEKGIAVSHFHIIENGAKCMDCHSTVAHLNTIPIGSANFPTMDKCMRCHNGQLAPTDCDLCHIKGTPEGEPPTGTSASTKSNG